jgi:nicotinamide-nucleotide amidase
MKIGLLIIASEILDGKILEANTFILADYLRTLQEEIQKSITVRDHADEIKEAFNHLLQECDVVITSGGLGPTKDDLTKDVLADYLNRKIHYSEESFKVAHDNYKRMNRDFPGKDHVYCYLPDDFTALSNSTGFAPCLTTEFNGKRIICGPGVPREFKSLLTDHFEKLTKNFKTSHFIDAFIIRTRKVPEEKIFKDVDPTLWNKLEAIGEVSSLPHIMGVDIGIKIKASTMEEIKIKKEQLNQIIHHSPVKNITWHIGRESLEEIIVTKAKQKKITFGFAESCTGGLCSHRITNIPGSSSCLMGSIVCYDERIKSEILGVKEETLEKFGAVSEQTAKEMATGLALKFSLPLAISITGFAGPGGGTPENPVGTVWIGMYSQGTVKAESFKLFGDREALKNRFSQMALYSLLDELEKFA